MALSPFPQASHRRARWAGVAMALRRARPARLRERRPMRGVARARCGALAPWLLTLWWVGVLASGCPRQTPDGSAAPVRVAAASDLMLAFEELGSVFHATTGQAVVFTFGSSGRLSQQVRQGAPFDVFASANLPFAEQAVASGACLADSQAIYARGRIVVWTRRGVEPPQVLGDLSARRFQRVGIANPEHAPYGVAAQEALQHVGIWEELRPRLVLGDNVRQALQFGETGNAEAVVAALPLVVLDTENPWFLIDEALHTPLDQALVVCTRGHNPSGGRAFAAFVMSAEGQSVMRRYGFVLPESPGATP